MKRKSKKLMFRKYKKAVSWLLAFAIVLPPYLTIFSPSVFARLQEAVRDFGGVFASESEKYAFIGIDEKTGRSAVFFFDGSDDVKIPHQGVTAGKAQYDEFSNKIVYQSLVEGIWQIFLYDLATNTTQQLSNDGANNTDPKISQGQVVWQSWVDGAWEIYFYDGSLSQRLTFNETHDIEPKISNGYVAWRQYDDVEFGRPDSVDPDAYEIVMYDSSKREEKRLTTDKIGDNSMDLEYPYIVWQKFDGNDYEIMVHYIDTGQTALLTDNDHDDIAPKIKRGKVIWSEDVKEVIVKKPDNLVEEDGQIKLKPKILPEDLPEWWFEPLKCPQTAAVCTYNFNEEQFVSYANQCFAIKAEAEILHEGICTGEEEVPSLEVSPTPEVTASPSEEFTPSPEVSPSPTASPSETFSPSPSPTSSPSFTASPSPTATSSEDFSLSPSPSPESSSSPTVTPSHDFEETASPSPAPEEETFSEPGLYESSGSFDEFGDLIIEERIPADFNKEASQSEQLPVVEKSKEPVLFEESTAMKVGEAVNKVVSNTASATANALVNLLPGGGNNEGESEQVPEEKKEEAAAEEPIIEVIEEPDE